MKQQISFTTTRIAPAAKVLLLLMLASPIGAEARAVDLGHATHPLRAVLASMAIVPAWQQQDEKMALYTKFYNARKAATTPESQKALYSLAKEYLNKYSADTDQYTEAVRKFVVAYERVLLEFDMVTAYNAKNYVKAFDLGSKILASEPENFYALSIVAQAGYSLPAPAKADRKGETLRVVRKGIELLEANKVAQLKPFETSDQARGSFYYWLGWWLQEESPAEAAKAVRKAIDSDAKLKSSAPAHRLLASTIVLSEYLPLSEEYREKFVEKPETEESKALLEKLRKAAERSVDALARAVALSTQPSDQQVRQQLLEQLTSLYKYLHGTDTGMTELISTVLSKPMP